MLLSFWWIFTNYLVSEIVSVRLIDPVVGNVDLTEVMSIKPNILGSEPTIYYFYHQLLFDEEYCLWHTNDDEQL